MKVAVLGASGYLGGEALRLILGHPELEPVFLGAGSNAGRDLADVRPSFAGVDLRLGETDPAQVIASGAETAFLALPHGTSAVVGEALYRGGLTVVDLGSDFRLSDPQDHPRYYSREFEADASLLDEASYCLPEVTGVPEGARLIASPGCFATALTLAIAPLVGHMMKGARLSAFGVTGSSGSGAEAKPNTHHPTRSSGFVSYKTLAHQHMGEIRQTLARLDADFDVNFVPHSGPFTRGIHMTLVVPKSDRFRPEDDLFELYGEFYAGRRLVTVREGPVNMGAAVGSARADIGIVQTEDASAVLVGIDNLLKGGASQAIQSLNLSRGWDETLGLPLVGIWP